MDNESMSTRDALDMQSQIAQRDFSVQRARFRLHATVGATSLELWAETDEFTGYGGVGGYSESNGNVARLCPVISSLTARTM